MEKNDGVCWIKDRCNHRQIFMKLIEIFLKKYAIFELSLAFIYCSSFIPSTHDRLGDLFASCTCFRSSKWFEHKNGMAWSTSCFFFLKTIETETADPFSWSIIKISTSIEKWINLTGVLLTLSTGIKLNKKNFTDFECQVILFSHFLLNKSNMCHLFYVISLVSI